MTHRTTIRTLLALVVLALAAPLFAAGIGPTLEGDLPQLFPPENWWNLDISSAPVDPSSAAFISHIGTSRALHPDFGGEESPGSTAIYGFPYIVVDGDQTPLAVDFSDGYPDECDGVDPNTLISFPYYPIPAEAITQDHWVEGGSPGNVDERSIADRHILVVDRDNHWLYELWNCWYSGTAWMCGSGAGFDLDVSDRRPEGWTSADAAGLAILPGLVRYDEAYGPNPITHAFRFTVSNSNGYVYPASHQAGSTSGALPMGARLRLKASVDISSYSPGAQKIFQAMKTYGLIVADNGSNMYISGTFDTRWDNGILNPEFGSLHASDFEVIQLGWPAENLRRTSVTTLDPPFPAIDTLLPMDASDTYVANVATGSLDPEDVLLPAAAPLIFYQLDGPAQLHLRKSYDTVQIVF